jgi:ribosomal protein L2
LVQIGKEIKVIKLKEVGVGESVFKVSLRGGERGKIARAAGAGCKVIKQEDKVTIVRLPSGEVVEIRGENTCYQGVV